MPIVSLIEYAQKDSDIGGKCNLFWFGEADSLEAEQAQKLNDVLFIPVWGGKLRRYRTRRSTRENLRDGMLVICAFFHSLCFLLKYQIEVVFCKGGHVALPVCVAAKLLRKKVVLHETDMVAGLTNRLVAKFADTLFS